MGDMGCFYMGMRIHTSLHAIKLRKEVQLVRHPTRKRRRNWSVKVTWHQDPAAYVLNGNTMVCHPAIYQKLQKEFS